MNPSSLANQLDNAISHLQKEFSALQIGRASTLLVEDVEVESYGSMMPLKSVANISCPDPKTIKIEPWDKSVLGNIERAIQEANLGINPQNMGEHLFLPIPPMTEDRRKQMVKFVHELAEKAKISIRNARHDELKMIKAMKEEGELSEDEQKSMEKKVQEKVDQANQSVDERAKQKEKDILTV
ncbi:ribosome recycling factor [bacterium]|nr:ribosome recycling factor [bacterium]NCQ54795.1 ribosome recycling factor [Candidatus Parcubacteria bacterium]NCS66839.1 ribosome recycling factor [Candidatus Peregrinibacteria bacterium]NCS95785.1 ribosome recycling factor [bacterium]